MFEGIAGASQGIAENTDNPYLGSVAEFVGYFGSMGQHMTSPSAYAAQARYDYQAAGGGFHGTLGVVNRYNPVKPFFDAASGVDLIDAHQLDKVERTSAGLNAFGTMVLVGTGSFRPSEITAGGAGEDSMLGGNFANPRSMRNVNPLRDTLNCGECAVYGDDILAGGTAKAAGQSGLTDLSAFERIYGRNWSSVLQDSGALEQAISEMPVQSRGLVFGVRSGSSVGHYFNFVNTAAGPVFLDFQAGSAISASEFSALRFLVTK